MLQSTSTAKGRFTLKEIYEYHFHLLQTLSFYLI